jgi:very-short-patch-repair endonuclease
MNVTLSNYIRYCLGYIKLTTRSSFLTSQQDSVELEEEYFSLLGLLNGDADGDSHEKITLKTFAKYAPLDVPKELAEQYKKEKLIAQGIEEIYNKYKNDQFTKQTVITFGYFGISLHDRLEKQEEDPSTDTPEKPSPTQESIFAEEIEKEKTPPSDESTKRYPLFTLPVLIEKTENNYSLTYSDQQIQVNLTILQEVLGEELYYQLLDKLGVYEIEGKFSLPQSDTTFLTSLWDLVKSQLKLTNVYFEDASFVLTETHVSLSPKVNYFLVDDLQKLTKMTDEEMRETSLTSWSEDNDLTNISELPEESQLYFPLLYDKYKLNVLSVLSNKAAIVEGPPGTGKSETIANLLCHLAANGKKVLFVSQKTQALKVVKDRLKKLDLQYLYGYIANPLSRESTEEDERDSVASHLAGLSTYIQRMGYKVHSTEHPRTTEDATSPNSAIHDTVAEKSEAKSTFNEVLDTERKLFVLDQEIEILSAYAQIIADPKLVSENLTEDLLSALTQMLLQEKTLEEKIQSQATLTFPPEFETLFANVNHQKITYALEMEQIAKDVEKTAFDRHGKLGRTVNNKLRNIRLSRYRAPLPREFVDFIDETLESDITRHVAHEKIALLHTYIDLHTTKNMHDNTVTAITNQIEYLGLDPIKKQEILTLFTSTPLVEIERKLHKVVTLLTTKDELLGKIVAIVSLTETIQSAEEKRQQTVKEYIQTIIDTQLLVGWSQGISMKQIAQRLAKAFGQSKRAFKTFDTLRKDPNNFKTILDIIPVWIMELDDASRIIPLEANLFDYVILDESSQCNVAYTLPVMYRSKHTIFFGDSEQMKDTTVRFKSNSMFADLARRYNIPDTLQIKAQSVLDIAKLRGFTPIPLQYHYRSPAELIGFSNKYFYEPKGKALIALNNKYLPYKDTNRIILIHEVDAANGKDTSDNTNTAEANAILEQFTLLREDPLTKIASVGILTFFNAQATLIRHLFESAGLSEEKDNYTISIIEGIQGDEKDIILYSFVIRDASQKNMYVPLTGEGGDINGAINSGRINVAFSRARLQSHVFLSMKPADFPDKIWLKRYLQYAQDHGEIKTYAELSPFDSAFEKEFYAVAQDSLGDMYRIQNQVESCGFKIDFVITNLTTGKRLAVECDGPTHFKDEIDEAYGIYTDSDIERQEILESAGWKFYRVLYSDWCTHMLTPQLLHEQIVQLLA